MSTEDAHRRHTLESAAEEAQLLRVCERAAWAGATVLQSWIGRFQVKSKGPSDLVTEADLASQEAVRATILAEFPSHDILGEEDRGPVERTSEYRWIVDPLDGTTNYVHGVPHYAVSIAVEREGALLAGVVYDPSAQENFAAARGHGAYLNGQRISASGTECLKDALVAISFPAHVEPGSREIEDAMKALVACQAVRRTGSAALNLGYVAAGRYDAYFARETRPWDVAAGALLVREAGGVLTGLAGEPFQVDRAKFISAGTQSLHKALVELVGDSAI